MATTPEVERQKNNIQQFKTGGYYVTGYEIQQLVPNYV